MDLENFTTSSRFRRLLRNAVIVPVLMMLMLAVILLWQVGRLWTASSWVEHTDRVIAQANRLQKLTLDLETGMRGFLLTGDEEFLEPYTRSLAVIHLESAALSSMVVDNPSQQRLTDEMESLRSQWLDFSAEQIARRRRGEDYITQVKSRHGKDLMDAIRERFHTFIDTEETLRNQRTVFARRTSELTLGLTGLVAALGGGLMAGLSRRQFILLTHAYDDALKKVNDLNAGLEKRVEERTIELQKRSAELLEANQELEAFSYSVSHDLRAPMRHITGFVDLLRKAGGDQLGGDGQQYLDIIQGAARLAGRMVDDLLAFSRVGRTDLRFTKVDLNLLVHYCRQELLPDTAQRNIEWVVSPLPIVKGDPGLLKLVLQNLLSNAVKYTSHRENARIEIGQLAHPWEEASPDPKNVEMAACFVRDNGVGFDMQYVGKLFGVFQRLHRAEEFEGTGIGLASVRRIIGRHGGRTWAKGTLGQGAAFFFSLPVASNQAQEAGL